MTGAFQFIVVLALGTQVLGLFGSEFVLASFALTVIALAQAISLAVGPVGNLLTMTANEVAALVAAGCAAALSVVISAAAIPGLGLDAAAVAVAVGIAARNLIALVAVRVRLGFIPIPVGSSSSTPSR